MHLEQRHISEVVSFAEVSAVTVANFPNCLFLFVFPVCLLEINFKVRSGGERKIIIWFLCSPYQSLHRLTAIIDSKHFLDLSLIVLCGWGKTGEIVFSSFFCFFLKQKEAEQG